jgi:hypothetical protein
MGKCGAGMFNCKPLAFLWGKFPDYYNEDNTIMFDDLRRNFVYNKQNGLVIRPFRNAHRTRATDRSGETSRENHSIPPYKRSPFKGRILPSDILGRRRSVGFVR